MRSLRSIALAIALSACSASHGADGDAGPVDCTPVDMGGTYTCPGGCMAVLGRPILEDRACLHRESTVIACYPSGASISGSGDVACFERPGAETRVWSSTGSIYVGEPFVGGPPSPELLTAQGWTRSECVSEATGEALSDPCPI